MKKYVEIKEYPFPTIWALGLAFRFRFHLRIIGYSLLQVILVPILELKLNVWGICAILGAILVAVLVPVLSGSRSWNLKIKVLYWFSFRFRLRIKVLRTVICLIKGSGFQFSSVSEYKVPNLSSSIFCKKDFGFWEFGWNWNTHCILDVMKYWILIGFYPCILSDNSPQAQCKIRMRRQRVCYAENLRRLSEKGIFLIVAIRKTVIIIFFKKLNVNPGLKYF